MEIVVEKYSAKFMLEGLNMSDIFNVYCDESCHLENDQQNVMVLGAVWCQLEKTQYSVLTEWVSE